MIDQIKKMEAEKNQLNERLKKLDTAIAALQDVCDHEYRHTAATSHYTFETCTKCNHTIKI